MKASIKKPGVMLFRMDNGIQWTAMPSQIIQRMKSEIELGSADIASGALLGRKGRDNSGGGV